jgi:hypothetical protein
MERGAPFDPADPFDASAEAIRQGLVDVVVRVNDTAIFRDLSDEMKLECLMAGLMIGAVGILLCFVREDHHDEFLMRLGDWLPTVREHVDGIMASGAKVGLQ